MGTAGPGGAVHCGALRCIAVREDKAPTAALLLPEEKVEPPQAMNALMKLNQLKPGLQYKLVSQTGPVHAPIFTMSVEIDGSTFEASGPSKKTAKLHVAVKVGTVGWRGVGALLTVLAAGAGPGACGVPWCLGGQMEPAVPPRGRERWRPLVDQGWQQRCAPVASSSQHQPAGDGAADTRQQCALIAQPGWRLPCG